MFVSGSADKTARIWDLRTSAAINIIPSPSPGQSNKDKQNSFGVSDNMTYSYR